MTALVEREGERITASEEHISIHTGWTVVGISGEKIGQVEDIQSDHIVVAKGFLFPSRWRVPISAIARVENDWVQLSVSRQHVEAQAWDQGSAVGVHAEHEDDVAFDDNSQVPTTPRSNVESGYLVDTRLSLKEVTIRRQPIASSSDADTIASGFADLEISIPVFGEQAVVRSIPVVRGMTVITRTVRERTHRITESVRREEIAIDGDVETLHDDRTRPYAI